MVPADSGRVSRARPYSGATREGSDSVAYGAFTRCGASFQTTSAEMDLSDFPGHMVHRWSHDPGRCPDRFRLVPVRSPLLGESRLLSSPPGTEMFQFPGLCGHPGINARSAAPPGLSQPSTSAMPATPRHPPRALGGLATPTGTRGPRRSVVLPSPPSVTLTCCAIRMIVIDRMWRSVACAPRREPHARYSREPVSLKGPTPPGATALLSGRWHPGAVPRCRLPSCHLVLRLRSPDCQRVARGRWTGRGGAPSEAATATPRIRSRRTVQETADAPWTRAIDRLEATPD